MTDKYCCPHCNRTYKRKIYFDRHVIGCSIMSKSKSMRSLELEELHDTPTLRELYDLVLEMGKKMSHMEERLDEMQKWVKQKKQKINIIEWLQGQYNPMMTFEDWIKNTTIKEDDILSLETKGFFEIIVDIFKKNISTMADSIPVRAFDKENNLLYVYSTDGWTKMPSIQLNETMKLLHKKFIRALISWKTTNIDHCTQTELRETNEMRYNKYIQKSMMAKMSSNQITNRMSNNLYKIIKQNIKDIVEYEINF